MFFKKFNHKYKILSSNLRLSHRLHQFFVDLNMNSGTSNKFIFISDIFTNDYGTNVSDAPIGIQLIFFFFMPDGLFGCSLQTLDF